MVACHVTIDESAARPPGTILAIVSRMSNTTTVAAFNTEIILCETRKDVRTSLGLETLSCGERFTVVDSYCVSDSDRCVVLAAMGIRIWAWITLGTRADVNGEFTVRVGSQSDTYAVRARAA